MKYFFYILIRALIIKLYKFKIYKRRIKMMNQINVIECPICMDEIEAEKNKVTTECGHCFHTSCLMKNVAHNGYGCPYCRTVMAEKPAASADDDESSDGEYDDEYSIEEEGPDYNDNVLRGFRWLFQRAEGEELDDEEDSDSELDEDEDRVEIEPRAPVDYIVEKLVQRGVTMADMVKSILIRDHDEYQFHDEFETADDEVFGKLRIIISNYQPPLEPVVAPAVVVAPAEEPRHYQSSRLRSYDSEDLDDSEETLIVDQEPISKSENVDRDDSNFEKFNEYFASYYSSERKTRYEKMTSIIEQSEESPSVKLAFNFQIKGSCRRN